MSKELYAAMVITASVVAGIAYMDDSAKRPGVAHSQSVATPSLSKKVAIIETHKDNTSGTGSSIYKCTANGKIAYSHQSCADGIAEKEVKIIETAGFVMPARHIVATTMARAEREREMDMMQLSEVRRVGQIGQSAEIRYQCEALDKHIEHLDAMARMAQPPQVLDSIRVDRRIAIDRKNALRC